MPTESSISTPSAPRAALAASFEPTPAGGEGWQRLAEAHGRGDGLALAAASAAMAQRCLAEQDLSEAHFHISRARQVLAREPAHGTGLLLQCELVGLLLALSRHSLNDAEPGAARRLADDTRDAGFQVVRHSSAIDDVGTRVAVLLRVAEYLEALGDRSDAQALRTQAFHGLGSGVGLTG